MNEPVIMRVDRKDFDRLKDGSKTWEIRLNDEKRKGIRAGDEIVFMRRPELEERLPTIVEEKQLFSDVQRLLDKVPLQDIAPAGASEVEWIQSFMTHYRPEELVQYGIAAFKVKKV
jgi:ASC-1-like (ASCH) protein